MDIDDKVVRVTNPDRIYFPARGETKPDLPEYYLSVGDGSVNALYERPRMLHLFPSGVSGEKGASAADTLRSAAVDADRPGCTSRDGPDRRRAGVTEMANLSRLPTGG